MNIVIEQDVLAQAIAQIAGEGIKKGLSHWEIQDKIGQAAKDAVTEAKLPELLHAELSAQLAAQADPILKGIVAEILPAIREAFRQAFRSALIAMVFGLRRGKPSYMNEADEREWQRIKEELQAES